MATRHIYEPHRAFPALGCVERNGHIGSKKPSDILPDNASLSGTTLWCRCGSLQVARRGLCAACYAREQHDRRFYAGLRSTVVARDGRLCRLCSTACLGPAALVVHHRRPGRSRLPWLVALCRACHARVHRLQVVRRLYPAPFLELWREQHPTAAEQLALSFDPRVDPAAPRSLFAGSDD